MSVRRWTCASGTHSSIAIGVNVPTYATSQGEWQVVEDRLVAREALVAHDLLDEQPAVVVADLRVALGRDVAHARRTASEVPPQRLLALDRLEERLEVALAEAARAVALDDLEEDRRPVAERLREDLQQVALVVAVDEDAEPAQVVERLVDLADALGQLRVVGVRRAQERDAARRQLGDRRDDVRRRDRDVLDARARRSSRGTRRSATGAWTRAGSLIGNFTRPSPLVTTFDISAEYSVEIASSEKWMSSRIPKTSS